eukprot:TRINITY_DN16052_c0_g1_i2.p2 TRINITY_DN16052_c0_g1~~TRINITY_DN16052_c0_g1_i2.p2  ORF type:complete len:110 (+),score=33.48 TRINITY_DN16052_c0_g1_i2:520-849(+)
MSEIDKHAPESAVRILVGNKSDLVEKRRVTFEEGRELAAKYNIDFIETSAKDAINVMEAFTRMCKQIKCKIILPNAIVRKKEGVDGKEVRTNRGIKIKDKKAMTYAGCC